MKTAIIGIRFKDEVTDDDIKKAVSDFYSNNDNLIKGMTFLEFEDPKSLDMIYEFIHEKRTKFTT